MRFSVGYQLRPSEDWLSAILSAGDDVAEVYFALPGFASGRGDGPAQNLSPYEAQEKTLSELSRIAQAGIPTNLLLNALCYGQDAQSRAFFNRVGDAVDYAFARLNTRSVTTASPLIARFVHDNFPDLSVRASVNMEIGTVRGMETVQEFFDGFYMKRELSRFPEQIERLKTWCDAHGKSLHMLANSGCVADCAMHVFHDNLVSHEREISRMDNAYDFRGVCWERLSTPEGAKGYLANATFVRPEDLHFYGRWFSAVKLATRVNRDPVRVLEAYRAGAFRGSLPSLMEPNHEGAFAPLLLENSRLPRDFFDRVTGCGQACEHCDYCRRAFEGACVRLNGDEGIC